MKNVKKHDNFSFLEYVHMLIRILLNCPYWFKVSFCYFIVLISAIPFCFGYQIYSVNNAYDIQDMSPECLSIDRLGYYQDRNFFNLTYSLNYQDQTTRDISFGLFRIFVNGPFYQEELRRFNIENIYQYQNDLYSISYELFQEGNTNFTIKCLDRDLFSQDIDVIEIQNSLKFSIFHRDDSISNVCFSGDENIIFVRNNIKFFNPHINNQFTYINSSVEQFLLGNQDFYISLHPVIDINQRTTFELISEILPFAFFLSKNSRIDNFIINSNESESVVDFVKSIIKEPVIQSNVSFINYCYFNNVRLYNYSIYQKLFKKTIKNGSKNHLEKNKEINRIYDSFKQISLSKYGNTEKIKKREKPKTVFAITSNVEISNLDELKEFFNSNENFKIVNMSELTLQQKIHEFSNAQIMICYDDENEIANAMWMPEESTLIALQYKKERSSSAIKFLKSLKIDVFSVDLVIIDNNQKVELPLKSIENILKDL